MIMNGYSQINRMEVFVLIILRFWAVRISFRYAIVYASSVAFVRRVDHSSFILSCNLIGQRENKSRYVTEIVLPLGYADVIFRRRESRQPEIRLLFHPVVPCMKNYRLIVDPAETKTALFCFLKATQIYRRIWQAVTYQNAAILPKPSRCWEKSGHSHWAFASLTICLTHGHLFGKFWRAAKSCQYTCWEDCKCVGETSHYWSGRWMEWFFCLAKSPLLVRVSTIGLSFRLWCIFLRRPFPLRFIFGFYFHNVYLVSQRIISKENRISEKQVISRYVCTECQSALSFYLVSNASRLVFWVRIAVRALFKWLERIWKHKKSCIEEPSFFEKLYKSFAVEINWFIQCLGNTNPMCFQLLDLKKRVHLFTIHLKYYLWYLTQSMFILFCGWENLCQWFCRCIYIPSYLHFLPQEQTESLAKMFLINPANKTRADRQARKPGRWRATNTRSFPKINSASLISPHFYKWQLAKCADIFELLSESKTELSLSLLDPQWVCNFSCREQLDGIADIFK